jgi:hypothetical protein
MGNKNKIKLVKKTNSDLVKAIRKPVPPPSFCMQSKGRKYERNKLKKIDFDL